MGAEKWVESPSGYLELIDLETRTVIAREKRRTPPRRRRGPRRPGRPSNVELAQVAKSRPVHKPRLYEYGSVLGDAIADAIVAGESLRALDPKHQFPPARALLQWRRVYPEFAEKIREAEEIREAIRFDRAVKHWDREPPPRSFERRGRPLGSKNKCGPLVAVLAPESAPEINWNDVPLVIARFGSWEAAMEYRKKITKS